MAGQRESYCLVTQPVFAVMTGIAAITLCASDDAGGNTCSALMEAMKAGALLMLSSLDAP